MASCIQATHSEVHASGSKPPFLRTAAQVVSSDEPRTKREQLFREASPSLPFQIDARPLYASETVRSFPARPWARPTACPTLRMEAFFVLVFLIAASGEL